MRCFAQFGTIRTRFLNCTNDAKWCNASKKCMHWHFITRKTVQKWEFSNVNIYVNCYLWILLGAYLLQCFSESALKFYLYNKGHTTIFENVRQMNLFVLALRYWWPLATWKIMPKTQMLCKTYFFSPVATFGKRPRKMKEFL